MTQLDLLERAKQGEPDAVAALMNLPLQSQGVTVKTELSQNCLHVVFTSNRSLNRDTLVSFTRRGLVNLDVQAFQRVKVYGQRVDELAADWVEEFTLAPLSNTQMTLDPTPDSEHRIKQNSLPAPESNPPQNWHHGPDSPRNTALPPAWLQNYYNRILATTNRWVARLQPQAGKSMGQPVSAPRRHQAADLPLAQWATQIRQNHYARSIAIAMLPAFLLGGIVALVASYTDKAAYLAGDSASADSNTQTQLSEREALIKQEEEVRVYLKKMNKAQQTFYGKNNRFASNLEELERSAATISLLSQKNNYIYKLNISDGDRSQLAATPRTDGLKSFAGIVIVKPNGTIDNPTQATICETQQPAKSAPAIETTSSGNLQCPAGSSLSS